MKAWSAFGSIALCPKWRTERSTKLKRPWFRWSQTCATRRMETRRIETRDLWSTLPTIFSYPLTSQKVSQPSWRYVRAVLITAYFVVDFNTILIVIGRSDVRCVCVRVCVSTHIFSRLCRASSWEATGRIYPVSSRGSGRLRTVVYPLCHSSIAAEEHELFHRQCRYR